MIENQWYAIVPSKLLQKNEILAVRRLGLDLALFRTAGGKIGCAIDQCPHRGAALSHGKIKGECIQCPFHGLEFTINGKCTFIPANGKASTLDISRYNVRQYPVRESNGIIYLWYGDEAKIPEKLPFFDGDVDSSYACSEIKDQWNAHYSRCIENQLDVVHVPIVHYNTIGRGQQDPCERPEGSV